MSFGTNFISATTVASSAASDAVDAISSGAVSRILMPVDYALKANDMIAIIGGIAKTTSIQWKNFLRRLDNNIKAFSGTTYASVKEIVDESLPGCSYVTTIFTYNPRARFVIEQYVYYALREGGSSPSGIDMSGTYRKVLYAENKLLSLSRSYRAEYHKRN